MKLDMTSPPAVVTPVAPRPTKARDAPTGCPILCGVGSNRMVMTYKLGVPGVSPLGSHTATLPTPDVTWYCWTTIGRVMVNKSQHKET